MEASANREKIFERLILEARSQSGTTIDWQAQSCPSRNPGSRADNLEVSPYCAAKSAEAGGDINRGGREKVLRHLLCVSDWIIPRYRNEPQLTSMAFGAWAFVQ